jgi:cytochrome c-type biogenesis protein CcmF
VLVDIAGSVALLAALFTAVFAFLAGIIGIAARRTAFTRAARYSLLATFPAVSLATVSLAYSLVSNNFSMSYVAEHSSRALPFWYQMAALWAGQEGSLLFWSWLLSIFVFIALLANRSKHLELMPTVSIILAGIQSFFLLLNIFVSNPFAVLGVVGPAGAAHLVTLTDGHGLNPLLQSPEMVLHPPLLYLGYTGFAVPFAFALAAMFRRDATGAWIHITRQWTMVAWSFLGVGILLGAHWAYAVLGWGGYWAWDPVENASLLPWLTATAFLHSAITQEKRGMMKIWSVWLIFVTFLLSILGTLLTRSGVVNSVHAFAKSSMGIWLTVFLALLLVVCLVAFLRNAGSLRTQRHIDAVLSRESSMLIGTFLLSVACIGVLWGTLLPVFADWAGGDKITVGPPFYNKISIPIALLLLLLMGITPLLSWGRNSLRKMKKWLRLSLAGCLAAGVAGYFAGVRNPASLACLVLGTFAAMIIGLQFFDGTRALASRSNTNPLSALRNLAMQEPRRYGGYIVHLGIVLIFFGISGQAFNRDIQKTMKPGDAMQIGPYTLFAQNFDQLQAKDYQAVRSTIEVLEGNRSLMVLHPERRFYPSDQLAESQVAIYSSLEQDLYVVYEGDSAQNGLPLIHAYLNPLVHWIWLGGLVMVLGTLLALLPNDHLQANGGRHGETRTISVSVRLGPLSVPVGHASGGQIRTTTGAR